MSRIFSLFLILLILSSCKKNYDNLTANDILSKSYQAYNSDAFFNSTITFNIDDLEYKLHRKANIQDFEVLRSVDTTTYKATYKNGSTAYIVNDKEELQSSMARLFIQIKLEGIAYLFSIPHDFNQNAVIKNRLEDVVIKKQDYYVLDVTFVSVDDDEPKNQFILYINKENFNIDYLAEDYDLAAPMKRLVFKVAYNVRTIEGIPFSDYYILKPKSDDINLIDLYTLYNSNSLEELEALNFENIKVKLNTEK